MTASRVIGARVPEPVFNQARRALGLPEDVPESDVIRAALAHAAGVDVDAHPVRKYHKREKVKAG